MGLWGVDAYGQGRKGFASFFQKRSASWPSLPVLILFARAPRLGLVKRRLARGIGPVPALRFYRNQLQARLRGLGRLRGFKKIVALTPPGARLRVPPGWNVIPQAHGDLGQRMHAAFHRFPRRRVILAGVDIPALNAQDIRAAARALLHHDAAFGPAADGGYYLVAMGARRPAKPFINVRWSTGDALADTMLNFPNLRVAMMRELSDVDTEEDLRTQEAKKRRS